MLTYSQKTFLVLRVVRSWCSSSGSCNSINMNVSVTLICSSVHFTDACGTVAPACNFLNFQSAPHIFTYCTHHCTHHSLLFLWGQRSKWTNLLAFLQLKSQNNQMLFFRGYKLMNSSWISTLSVIKCNKEFTF